jgi:hypothetical protein
MILVAVALGAASLFVARGATAADLGGTEWDSTNSTCGIDEIDFDSDGSAHVYDYVSDDDDTGTWTTNGDRVHIDYDTWYGGIDGSFTDDEHFEGSETWRDDKTHAVKRDECDFELQD